jgi:hypothetical protein
VDPRQVESPERLLILKKSKYNLHAELDIGAESDPVDIISHISTIFLITLYNSYIAIMSI